MLTIQRSFITKAQSSEEEEQLYQIVEQYMPYLAGLLYQLWQNQSKAITYRELKDMLSSGFVSPTLYTDWRKDYQNFVNNNLQSVWDDAIHAAADTYKNKYPDFQFVSSDESIRRWNMEHAAQLITRCTDEQYNALKALVHTATETDGATPDKLARSIRPLIGLNEPQARANQRYYNTLIANDVPREIAEQRRKLYTEQQLQYRAQMIARTELAASYNGGHYLSVLQAQQQGLMGECKRIWRTADTERTCSYCAALDGTEVGMEEDFIFTHGRQTTSVTTPPAHPHCMCTLTYEEIAQPEESDDESQMFRNPQDMNDPSALAADTYSDDFGWMNTYRDEDGDFDLQSALDDYRRFLQNVPKKCRISLESSMDSVAYKIAPQLSVPMGYSPSTDCIRYNPKHPRFYTYNSTALFTHELAHRIDNTYVEAYKNKAFTRAIENSREILEQNIEKYQDFCCKNFNNGFLSDIFSAICEDDYVFPANHSKAYWQKKHTKEAEIFANLFSLETFRDVDSLQLLKNDFTELFEAYNDLEYLI